MKSDYFARKFEPVVSHEVVLRVDARLYGDYPPGTPGLHTYWESVYHSEDRPSLPGDSAYSLYMSFMRIFMAYIDKYVCVCVCVRACGRACVRACVSTTALPKIY